VRELEEEVARATDKQAALFVTSGTMGNQLAIACHTRPGDEVIIGEGAHVAFYEVGAGAALSGVQFLVAGRGGLFDAEDFVERIKPDAYYYPRTSLVALENTHNRAGGRVFPQASVLAITAAARERSIACHLDGARIWNASVATGRPVAELCAPFDTVSLCFSKGLGAPVGSALAGTRALVDRARRLRKMWGGGMRQAGILAAGALYALDHHRSRLADDHTHARALAHALIRVEGVYVRPEDVETNIVNIDLAPPLTAEHVARAALRAGVAINASGPTRLRAVTHLDVSGEQVLDAAGRLAHAIASVRRDGGAQ
jgi:threonine aldolase